MGSLVCIFPEGELTRTSQVKPFERGVDVITHDLHCAPVVPVYLDGLWGHAFSLKGGRPFASRLKLRHEVTICVGEPMTGDIRAEQLHQRVVALGAQVAEFQKDATATLACSFIDTVKRQWSSVAIAGSALRPLASANGSHAPRSPADRMRRRPGAPV
jgi:acyl-[acyl-carrier-protein]-phospholipid O-acyltransferase/long-chain-fatty-acid--[acyl-carrier-protein] ligase